MSVAGICVDVDGGVWGRNGSSELVDMYLGSHGAAERAVASGWIRSGKGLGSRLSDASSG